MRKGYVLFFKNKSLKIDGVIEFDKYKNMSYFNKTVLTMC